MAARFIMLLGSPKSGRTQLTEQMAGHPFDKEYKRTVTIDFVTIESDKYEHTIQFCEGSNKEPLKSIIETTAYRNKHLGLYCVDLSNDNPNLDEMITDIMAFQRHSPVPVILVGTKADACKSPQEAEEKLGQVQERLRQSNIQTAPKTFVTSSKNNEGIKELFHFLMTAELDKIMDMSPWMTAVSQLQHDIKKLSPEKQDALLQQINALKAALEAPQVDRAQVIDAFINQCDVILEGKHPHVKNSVLTLAAVAAVTVVAALIGFGIGLAAGCWTGPGAFFTALMGGAAAAAAVIAVSSSLGIVTGGLTAHGLFKPSNESQAIDDFAQDVKNGLNPK